MQANEFEKQVRQKMDELKFSPSDAVWQKIEPHIRKEKRRRWLLLFFPALLIGGLYGGYLFLNNNNSIPQSRNGISKTENKKSLPAKDQTHITEPVKDNIALNEKKEPVSQKPFSINKSSQKLQVKSKLKIKVDHKVTQGSANDLSQSKPTNDSTVLKGENIRSEETSIKTENRNSGPETNKVPAATLTQPADQLKQKDVLVKDTSELKIENQLTAENVIPAEIKKTAKAAHPWRWGITFSAGTSGPANLFFSNGQKSLDFLSSPISSGSYSGGPLTPSVIRSSLGFIAGIALEKNISDKTIFTTGIHYKLFNTTNTVGADSVGFFRAGYVVNKYHNHFHFIELPVGFKFQVAGFKRTKLLLNTGLSLSRLISTNALQLNYNTGFYYHDNSLFNKTQLGFNAGLDIDLNPKQNRQILIGPYLNYSISKMAGAGYNKYRFTFTGLKAQYFFRRK